MSVRYYAGVVNYTTGNVEWTLNWAETTPGIAPIIDNSGLSSNQVGIVFTDPINGGATGLATITAVINNVQVVGSITALVPAGSPLLPIADFNDNPFFGDTPLTVSFIDRSHGNPTSWEWDFQDDGLIDSTEQNPLFTYDTPGTYSVKLTVSNAAGSNTIVKQNEITVNPVAPFKYFKTLFANAFSSSPEYGAISQDGLTYISIGLNPPAPVPIGTFDSDPEFPSNQWHLNPGFTPVGGGYYMIQPVITFSWADAAPVDPGYTFDQPFIPPGAPNLVQMNPIISGRPGDQIYLRANQFGDSGSTVGGPGTAFDFVISIGPNTTYGELYKFTSTMTNNDLGFPANIIAQSLPLSEYATYGMTHRGYSG